jgi:hypothetical protein
VNDEERDAYRPRCGRCNRTVTDIDWLDSTPLGGPESYVVGMMRCSAEGCYDEQGSRQTRPVEERAAEQLAWHAGITMAEAAETMASVMHTCREITPTVVELYPGLRDSDRRWIREMSNARFDTAGEFAQRWAEWHPLDESASADRDS